LHWAFLSAGWTVDMAIIGVLKAADPIQPTAGLASCCPIRPKEGEDAPPSPIQLQYLEVDET
jgi:hypothetical protein